MAGRRAKFTFTWKIENFTLCYLKNKEALESPKFKAENLGGSKWFLSLYPKGQSRNDKSYVSLFLYKVEDHNERYDCSLEFMDHEAKVFTSRTIEKKVFDEESWGFTKFFSINELNKMMTHWKDDTLNIRCQITGDSKLINNPDHESIAWTKIAVDRCTFKWKVGMSGSLSWMKKRNVFISENSHLSLTLTSPTDSIDIRIRNVDKNKNKSKLVFCKISLISQKKVEIKSKSDEYLFGENSDQDIWKFPTFFSKTYLQSKAYDILKKNEYTLKFEISIPTGENFSEVKINSYDNPLSENTCLDDSISALQEDLRSLLNTDKGADVKFRVDDRFIPANKVILRARSPVFSAMFDLDMLENQTGIVEIQDLDAETVIFLLVFIYTGSVNELNFERAKKLLVAADKYQIPSLSKKCSLYLDSKLSVENVCDVYALAAVIGIESLKVSALKFIIENSRIILSSVWSNWMRENVTLANEILFELARNSLE